MFLSVFPISDNMTLIPEVFTLAGTMTEGWLGLAIWILVFFGTFAITSGFRTGDSLIASSFIGLITGIILYILELLKGEFLIIIVLITVGSIIFAKTSRGGYPT